MPSFINFHGLSALHFKIFCDDSCMFTASELGNIEAIFQTPWLLYLAHGLSVGTVLESKVRPAGVQLKRKAKLSTVIGMTIKYVVSCDTLML